MKSTAFRKIVIAVTLGVVAACDAARTTQPTYSAVSTGDSSQLRGGALRPAHVVRLLNCPTTTTVSSTALVAPTGGVVTVAGTSITIPSGALLTPTVVTVTVPASRFMEIDVSVLGVEHFVFEQPVTVTVSYARCSNKKFDRLPLSVWHIDSETKALLESMGGVDDKLARTVTFTTGHLSGYAVAN